MNGYAHPSYVKTLSDFGVPSPLTHCGGTVLVRQVPGFPDHDAMGGYPLFACNDWSKLHLDLDEIGHDLVSLSMVADPHGCYEEADLHRCFDRVVPFKQHYVVDLSLPLGQVGSAGRRKKAHRALRKVEVEVCENPVGFLEEWCSLYDILVKRHDIAGIRAFSRSAFAQQLALPGVVVLKATHEGVVVGALIFFVQGEVAYGHLGAVSERGYELRATYALDWFSFNHFSGKVRLIDLGGGVAMAGNDSDGLGDYKRGWATATCPVYFCGRIFNPERYEVITQTKSAINTRYFPAYRQGEFD